MKELRTQAAYERAIRCGRVPVFDREKKLNTFLHELQDKA
jgi:hypothetical protein